MTGDGRRAGGPSRVIAPVAALAVAAAAGAMLWVVRRGVPAPPDAGVPEPPTRDARPAPPVPRVELEVVTDTGEVVDRVYPDDRLRFRVTTRAVGWLLIFGRDDTGTVYPCYPQDTGGRPERLDARPDGVQLAPAIQLDAVLGHERITAILCPHPVDYDDASAGRIPAACARSEVVLTKVAR